MILVTTFVVLNNPNINKADTGFRGVLLLETYIRDSVFRIDNDFVIINNSNLDTIYRSYRFPANLDLFHYVYEKKYYKVSRFMSSWKPYQWSLVSILKYNIMKDTIKFINKIDLGFHPMDSLFVKFRNDTLDMYFDSTFYSSFNLRKMKKIKTKF